MPQHARWNTFDAGWIPSDDSIDGRKNGLLQMDNLELDRNGALSLIGGTTQLYSLGSRVHTLYSRYMNGSRCDYSALANGQVYRNSGSIFSGGDGNNAAFGTAFDFTLIASGNVRKKDTGSTLYNLGIGAPTLAPTLAARGTWYSRDLITANFTSKVDVSGTNTIVGTTWTLQIAGATTPTVVITQATCSVTDMSDLPNSGVFGSIAGNVVTDQDIFRVALTPNGDWSTVNSLRIDFLLVNPAGSGSPVSDYYSLLWTNPNFSGIFPFMLEVPRSDFERVGNGGQTWATVYGVRITVVFNPNTGINTNLAFGFGNTYWRGGLFAGLNGDVEYAQMNVFNTGSYLAKSELGPILTVPQMREETIDITPQTPSDASVNEVWIFRRGSNLQQWYRVLKLTVPLSSPYLDTTDDTTAQEINITVNLNLVSIASSSISDKIYDIIGPIEGRWFYFTSHFMYPSDVNDPDLVDASEAVRTTGANSENFLWARRISESAVLVGTSVDIYLLSGTFTTLPDNTVDIFYRSMGCKYPPISNDATVFDGTCFYLAADGWRLITPSLFSTTYGGGANELIVAPNLDRLYRGITCYGYNPPNLAIQPGTTRFPVIVGKNKLWCCIAGQARIEVYDFVRKYWRPVKYDSLGDVTAITFTQDGLLLAAFASDNKLRVIDVEGASLLIDGSTAQVVNILSPVFDGPIEQPMPRQRKDLYTLKCRFYSAGQNMTFSIIDDLGASHSLGTALGGGSTVTEAIIDISQIVAISKTFQIQATGSFSNLVVAEFSVEFDARPSPLTFLRLYNSNFGNAGKKRIRVWPQIIDTLGSSVTFTPVVDGTPFPATTLVTSDKTTALVFFKTDAFGIDYGATLSGGPFEYWGALDPDIVQTLPIARQYDQVGPEELFKYGRIKEISFRVLPYGTILPINFFFDDSSVQTINLQVTNGIEDTYTIGVPKTTGGNVVRIEIGPTAFNFHRYYLRLLVQRTGTETDLEWVILPKQ